MSTLSGAKGRQVQRCWGDCSGSSGGFCQEPCLLGFFLHWHLGPASLNREEGKARQEILDGSMGQGRAKLILENVDPDTPFYSKVTFIEGLAAICRCFPEEVGRKVTGSNKEVAKVLWSAAALERLEWLFNNLRIWHAMTPLQRALLPSGTASNEALHAERMEQSQQDAAPKHLAAQIAHHAVCEATWWMALV